MTGTNLEQIGTDGMVEATLEWRGGSIARQRKTGSYDWVIFVTAYGDSDCKALVSVEEALRSLRERITQEIGTHEP